MGSFVVSAPRAADLRDVMGRLRLDPSFPAPHVGRLDLSVHYASGDGPDYGVIDLKMLRYASESDAGADVIPSRVYRPLQGSWGSRPSTEPDPDAGDAELEDAGTEP